MSNKISEIIKTLSQRDVEALKSIYSYRCLTANQIYELHYNKSLRGNEEISDTYCKKKIAELISLNLIEKVEYADIEVFFLTPLGIEVIKYCFDLPTNIYDAKRKVVKRGYYRASELKISGKYISHQVQTNQFLIDFQALKPDFYWKYFDEKYISQFTNIRPDGLLSMFDIDFFIEMDMATESKKQLLDKWMNYRNFLNSREYQYSEKKIVVLFIIEGTDKKEARIDLVKHTINEGILDKMDSNFEIFVDTKENILKMLQERYFSMLNNSNKFLNKAKDLLNNKYEFQIASGEKIKELFNNTEYWAYCRKKNPNGNNIVVENGKVQEYIFDLYHFSPMSVIKKIAYLDSNNVFFKSKFNREISYVIIGEKETQLYHDLKVLDLLVINNVYFTTLDRMEKLPFHEALFQFDFLGNIHHFTDSGLKERCFECNISELQQWWEN